MNIIIIAAVVLVTVIGVVIYATRAARAKQLRESEQRRSVDKGKHVEL